MTELATYLMVASAAVLFVLGLIHLIYTFSGPKLTPRDPELRERMNAASLVISRETTVWNAWVGFNASHAFGAMLFGLVYSYLAIFHRAFLFQSPFLIVVGFALLAGYTFLSMRYWFRVPFRGALLATILYAFAVISAMVWGI
jgi:hypothetical protein